ncbi:hypothetical protein [Cyclobacterium roseum]|uniref:hypothetical protein n=1 Tax=Cyclobacterium roseum TaxID=2666137 RepID=UPI0013920B0D|nr:hypothetical protein [Cyclobacterium roseum]
MILSTLKDIQSISSSLNLLRTYSDSHFYSSFLNCSCQNAPRRVIESYKQNWVQAEDKLSRLRSSNQNGEITQPIELNEKIKLVLDKLGEVNTSKINEKVENSYSDIRNFVAIDNIPANEKKIEELYQAVEELKSSIIQYLSFVNFLN